MTRLMKKYELNRKLSKQILDSEYADLFEVLTNETMVSPTVIAVTLTETLKALRREAIEVEKVTDEQFRELFGFINSGKTTKEAIPEIVIWLTRNEGATAKEAVESLGLAMISQKELERTIDDLIERNKNLVKKRGKGAFGPLMGMVMKKVRGRAKAELVSEILKKHIEELVT